MKKSLAKSTVSFPIVEENASNMYEKISGKRRKSLLHLETNT